MKHNKFSKLIEHILVALPLIYVAGVGAYTIFNKNAKDSFSDYSIASETKLTSASSMVVGQTYSVFYYDNPNISNTQIGPFYFDTLSFDPTDYGWADLNYKRFSITYSNGFNYIYLFDDNNFYSKRDIWGDSLTAILFTCSNVGGTNVNTESNIAVVYNTEYRLGKLDNALPYAMNEFNKIGFGKINFVGWFVDLFMIGNTYNVYVTFINSYLNYFLFAEVCYFIPMIFYWFIHFGERVIDRFSRKEY